MKPKTIKGLVHAALAVASFAEQRDADTKTRTFLLGLATGWHIQAAMYHFLFEEE